MEQDSVTNGEVFQAHGRQLTVGNGHDGSVQRPDAGRTNSNVFDRSEEPAHPARIAHLHWLVGNHHDPAEQVLNRFLRAEANSQAADAQPGQRGSQIDI